MNALIAARTTRSVRSGIVTGLGAMSADLVLALVVLGFDATFELHRILPFVEAAGALVLTAFAYRLIRAASADRPDASGSDRVYLTALVVGVSNPFQVLWWLSAGLAFAYVGGVALFAGLFAAITVWVLGFPWLLDQGLRRSRRAPRVVTWGSAALLFGFAGYFALAAVGWIG